ncbi:TerB family tellurite resistance protein [Exiguobacterium sp. s168]|uniref:tellurite resistance TerB family protein n=1 Tax=Exiguobacterium sp. s168 TaxID=2751194 RepID=UPI00064679F7|nr:TerB family tellurite resistance protein [Exiguobacterium sp. s168]
MGLFDMFKGDSTKNKQGMHPHFAFATSLVYMMASDGEFDNEEIGQLLAVLGGKNKKGTIRIGDNNDDLMEKVFKYFDRNSIDTFLAEAAPVLNHEQKLCILANLVDSSLSDGEAEREEQAMFNKFMTAFGVTEQEFAPIFKVIAMKNDRSVFKN